MIISRTPFRISFFGGGTDFPEFYREHGGCTLSTSINQYCYILLHPISACFAHRFKVAYAKVETVDRVADIQHPLVREALRFQHVDRGLEVDHVADLPAGTGLGTSSSFTVGLLNALHCFKGERAAPAQLAREAIHVERDLASDPGGHQDQYAAAFGGLNRVDYTAEAVRVTPLTLSSRRSEELQNHLMLFYLGTARSATPIVQDQKQRTAQNAGTLTRMKELVDEAQQVLTSARDLKAFGLLLHEGWTLKRTLAEKMTNPHIDEAYEAARRAGAWGGKLLGAGGGGFLMVMAEAANQTRIAEALSSLWQVRAMFESDGATILYGAPATP